MWKRSGSSTRLLGFCDNIVLLDYALPVLDSVPEGLNSHMTTYYQSELTKSLFKSDSEDRQGLEACIGRLRANPRQLLLCTYSARPTQTQRNFAGMKDHKEVQGRYPVA